MAIVKMKRLHLIALAQDRDALLASLQHVGCVELREPGEYLADESYAALLHRETSDLAQARGDLAELQHAIEALRQYAPQKGSLFAPRAQLGPIAGPVIPVQTPHPAKPIACWRHWP